MRFGWAYFPVISSTIQIFIVQSAFAAFPSTYFGRYSGFDLERANQGFAFEQSSIDFRIKKQGLDIWGLRDELNRNWRTLYSMDWITEKATAVRALSTFERRCFGVRRNLNSDRVRFILCFDRFSFGSQKTASMHSAQDLSVTLALFYKDNATGNVMRKELSELYDRVRAAFVDRDAVDFAAAPQTLQTGDLKEKVNLLNSLQAGSWLLDEEEVAQAMDLVKMGLADPELVVQAKALDVLIVGGRVTQAVPMVLELLRHPERLEPVVLNKAIDAAALLALASGSLHRSQVLLQRKFNSIDPAAIYTKTGGIVEAEEQEAVEGVLRARRKSQAWTLWQNTQLLLSLTMIAENHALPEPNRLAAKRALENSRTSADSSNYRQQCSHWLGGD